jgi:hypothetical protein
VTWLHESIEACDEVSIHLSFSASCEERMMSNVVKIGGTAAVETVEDFVRRRGSVTSHEVGRRFGWTYEEAHRHMKKLQKQGVICGETEKSMVNGGGRDLCWTIQPISE